MSWFWKFKIDIQELDIVSFSLNSAAHAQYEVIL